MPTSVVGTATPPPAERAVTDPRGRGPAFPLKRKPSSPPCGKRTCSNERAALLAWAFEGRLFALPWGGQSLLRCMSRGALVAPPPQNRDSMSVI